MKKGKILLIDDNKDILSAGKIFLKRYFQEIVTEQSPEIIPDLLSRENFDVILLDMNFTKDVSSGSEGFYWLDQVLTLDPGAVVVMITAFGDVDLAVKAIKEGATDFVQKPWENEKLLGTLMSAMKLHESRKETEKAKQSRDALKQDIDQSFGTIIGQSDEMMEVFKMIDAVAPTEANVLILGENGTGKELIAREIHKKSDRAYKEFLSVDLGALSENLFESELFGHKRGAYTDAKSDRIGRFELASEGTLFLDEIGNLSLPMQAKLLTAIQNKTITKLGSNEGISIDTRIISATNMPLSQMIEEKKFRQDLLYRINTIEIKLPPLRNRTEDVPALAEHFREFYSKKYSKSIKKLSQSTINRMKKYDWPGNIREMQHSVERAVILTRDAEIDPSDLFPNSQMGYNEGGFKGEMMKLDDLEKLMVRKAMTKFNGNISHAAEALGITRSSLYRRLEKHEL